MRRTVYSMRRLVSAGAADDRSEPSARRYRRWNELTRPTRQRDRQPGRGRSAGRPVLGRPDAAVAASLLDRRRPHAEGGHPGHGHPQEGSCAHQPGPRQAPGRGGEAHRPGRRRDHRRRARRRVPALRLADGQRYADEHERQRGDLEPRHRARGRRTRQQGADPPQRPREHVAVVERHLPDGDAHRRRRGGGAPPDPVGHGLARRVGGEGGGVRRHRQDRAHPPAGRGAADAGPGVRRLRRPARRRPRAHRGWRSPACTSSPSAAPPSGRASTRRPISTSGARPRSPS